MEDKVIHRHDRNMHGGGVIIALQTEIKHHRIFFNSASDIEYVCVLVEKHFKNEYDNIILCIYNPPA
jgi:hypothetical protein